MPTTLTEREYDALRAIFDALCDLQQAALNLRDHELVERLAWVNAWLLRRLT